VGPSAAAGGRTRQPPGTLYVINHVEMAIAIIIVFVASFMARGF